MNWIDAVKIAIAILTIVIESAESKLDSWECYCNRL